MGEGEEKLVKSARPMNEIKGRIQSVTVERSASEVGRIFVEFIQQRLHKGDNETIELNRPIAPPPPMTLTWRERGRGKGLHSLPVFLDDEENWPNAFLPPVPLRRPSCRQISKQPSSDGRRRAVVGVASNYLSLSSVKE